MFHKIMLQSSSNTHIEWYKDSFIEIIFSDQTNLKNKDYSKTLNRIHSD